ncbi:MAG: flavodoxin family protein, partial [Thermodesulfobacteriota bacterium]|nr:flavodoxin family protein [Thermodesulfobacteriota bacterium]
MKKPFILGFSASLRNARSREGSKELVRDLAGLKDREALHAYLVKQGNLHLDQYFQAGRKNGVPYDEMYKALKKMGGRKGLSNSEVCLAAALWGACDAGMDVDHLPLADYFKADGTVTGWDEIRESLLRADGVLISTPVYFGDRSSLSQSLIEMIRRDKELREGLKGKIYGGLAVGAKRNGGQETTLIYQMHDMMDLGLLGVGNDFETTSQYGGTGHAGDVGMMPKDDYGIGT